MASYVFTNGYLTLASTAVTSFVESIELDAEVDEVEFTNHSSSGVREYKGGLKKNTLKITFQQDFAAGSIDATIWSYSGSLINFEVRPTQSARSSTNPAYVGWALVSQYPTIVGGKVGDKATVQVSWPCSGTVSRATS